jgi:hypothetical protein
MGIALCTYIISQRQAYHWNILRDTVNVGSPVDGMVVNQISSYLAAQGISPESTAPGALYVISSTALKNAYMYGIDDVTIVLSIILITGLPLMLLLNNRRVTRERARQELLTQSALAAKL